MTYGKFGALNQEFNTAQDTSDTNPFLCGYWDASACDPSNWTYEPSTYDVDGVTLVGDKEMVLWSDLKFDWINPGRVSGTDPQAVNDLAEDIRDTGVQTDGSVVYYDAVTKDGINCYHRERVSEILQIPGWMAQAVHFDSEEAKIRFATISNNRKPLLHRNSSKRDVQAAAEAIYKNKTGTVSQDQVKADVEQLGWHLSPNARTQIWQDILHKLNMKGDVRWSERFSYWTSGRVHEFIDTLKAERNCEWVRRYWVPDNKFSPSIFVDARQFEARCGQLLKDNAKARINGRPLHILFSVVPPQGDKNTLESIRDSFFSTQLSSVEDRVLTACGFALTTENRRNCFAWNHPECQHRTVAQQQGENEKQLLKVRNRTFN